MMTENRRKNRRATVQLLVSETSGGKLFLPLLSDISERGILLESPTGLEMPKTHSTFVELMLPGIPQIIYARCRTLRESDHGFFKKRALEFVDISAIHRKLVSLHVQRVCGIC